MKKSPYYTMTFASIYPMYVTKVEKKGRSKEELDTVLCWLTGYTQKQLEKQVEKGVDLETFFKEASNKNPLRKKITGVICGMRVEEIEEEQVREVRYMDKVVDELARGKKMESILRT